MDPVEYNITIHQGATFSLPLEWRDGNNVPINMSGYTVKAQLWDREGTTKMADFTTTWLVQASGRFELGLSDAVTSGITKQGAYDILVSEPSGKKYYIMEGIAFLNPGLSCRA